MANIKGFLKKAFPFISAVAVIGGPPAVMAANLIGKALGTDPPDPTSDGISTALANLTPDQAAAIKQVELQVQEEMQQYGFKTVEDLLSLDTTDRDSARTMQEKVPSHMPSILACIFIAGFFGTLYFIARGMVDAQAHDVVLTMVGVLGGGVTAILSYYFGSSAGSAAKTDILAKMADGSAK